MVLGTIIKEGKVPTKRVPPQRVGNRRPLCLEGGGYGRTGNAPVPGRPTPSRKGGEVIEWGTPRNLTPRGWIKSGAKKLLM